jgi:hypothetical protein
MNRNVTSVFLVNTNGRPGDLIVGGNKESLKFVIVNYADGSDDSNKTTTIEMDSWLEIERLYETLGKILEK